MVVLKSVLMGTEVFWQSSPLGQLELVAEHSGSVSSSSNRNQRNVSENHPMLTAPFLPVEVFSSSSLSTILLLKLLASFSKSTP